jgi:hypothetical protein
MVRTDKDPEPLASVTPLADQVEPAGVAVTQVEPLSALIWIVSSPPSAPVKVPLTVCAATLVMKSPAVPLSVLSAAMVATAVGSVVSRV